MAYQGGLRRWHKEKWKNVKTGKDCGDADGGLCRPSKRVSSKTPKTISEMSPAEKKRKIAEKQRLGQPAGKPRRIKPIKRGKK
tara:strand:+ start:3168 stop:3416 length:249 start_codon:yes stop_codon:yes gene_type:complete